MDERTLYTIDSALEGTLGLLSTVGNALVVATIFARTTYRRRYVLIAALSTADGLDGLGFFLQAIWGVVYIQRNSVISSECTLGTANPFTVVPVITSQLSALLIFAIALDRTLCVCFPFDYFTFPVYRVHWALVAACYLYGAGSIGFIWPAVANVNCSTFTQNTTITLPAFDVPWFYTYYASLLIVTCGAALVMSGVIFCRLRRQPITKLEGVRVVGGRRQQQRQTMTMLYVVVVNGGFYFMPPVVAIAIADRTIPMATYRRLLTFYCACLILNAILDVFVYAASNRNFRAAMIDVLCCRRCRGNGAEKAQPFVVHAQYNRHRKTKSGEEPNGSTAQLSTCDVVLNSRRTIEHERNS